MTRLRAVGLRRIEMVCTNARLTRPKQQFIRAIGGSWNGNHSCSARLAGQEETIMELPKLPERIARLHVLRWYHLIKSHGFTDDHLKWHQSQNRRHKARPTASLAPPPPIAVSDRYPSRVEHYGSQGEPIAYDAWLKKHMAACAARQNDPDIIDSIGVFETVALANERLAGIVGDYLAVWAETNGNADDFSRWLEAIRHLVGDEVGDLWRQGEWHAAWFERACRRKVHHQLRASAEEWKSRASALEIQHLENPHLSLRFLLVAGGDLNFALTLEQSEQTIKSAQRLLMDLQTTDSTAIGESPIPADGLQKSPGPRASEPAAGRGVAWESKAPSQSSEQSHVIVSPQAKPVERPKRRPGKQAWDTGFEKVKAEIRGLKKAKLTQVEICLRLGKKMRPPNARWDGLTWPMAFRHPDYKNSVKSWISRL
jgi:hypothetical protein